MEKRLLYCICPECKILRQKKDGRFTIIRKGLERSKTARFHCQNCGAWFNERTGQAMRWMER